MSDKKNVGRNKKSDQQRDSESQLRNLGSTEKKVRPPKNPEMAKNPEPPKNPPAPPVEPVNQNPPPPTPPVPPAPPAPETPPAPEPNKNESQNPIHQPNANYDPLSGPVDTRSYQTRPVDTTITSSIEEVEFEVKGPQINPNPAGANTGGPTTADQKPPYQAPVNPIPGQAPLNSAEARRGAEMVTDMVLSGYKAMHKIAQKLVEVDDNHLINLHIDGKIDYNMRIPLNPEQTKHLALKDFFSNFNAQAKQALTVSQEFIDSVREPMINCCIKWGWTAPEEYYVLYKFGEDIGIKVMMVAGLMKTTKNMMKMFMHVHSENKRMHEEQMAAMRNQQSGNGQNQNPEPPKNPVTPPGQEKKDETKAAA